MSEVLDIVTLDLGARGTPQEIQKLRKSNFQYHTTYGMPVIHKHRWNQRDIRNGLAQECPYHDEAYDQGSANCDYCFGTGILGGYANGQIVHVTFADAPESRIKIGPNGVLLFQTDPDMQAPWLPEMGTGDLIIQAEFTDDMEILSTEDRFVLDDVRKITMRGFQDKVQTVEFRVNQQATVRRVPDLDSLYDVPLVFNYDNVPIPPFSPGDDDDDRPVPGAVRVSVSRSIRLIGRLPGGTSSVTRGIAVNGFGVQGSTTRGLSLVGEAPAGDVDVFFTEE